MYPSLPQNPSPMMQGGNPSQQFGYPPSQMNQGIGGLVPQSPVYGSQPVYMADGGPVMAGMSGNVMAGMSGKGQQPQPGQGSGKGQQAPMQQGQSAKGQMAAQKGMPQQAPMRQAPVGYQNATDQQKIAGFFSNAGQQAPMQMPGTSMNSAMEDFARQQKMGEEQRFGGKGQGMGPQPTDYAPGQMPRQGYGDMRADFDRFQQGRRDTTAGFREAMKNPNLTLDQKRQMISEFRAGADQSRGISQDLRQRMQQARQVGQQQMPQQMTPQDMMRQSQAMEIARMQGIPIQQALPAGIQALANFRPQY
jgi:hypothetical protein